MTHGNRREFLAGFATLGAAGATLAFPPAIRRALAIAPHRCTGTIKDVEHIVILMQENRSFDHYFGTLRGVRGFGDRFPIPVPDAAGIEKKTVWYQPNALPAGEPAVIAPFRLNTEQRFEYMRVTGTPHSWPNAQRAWADGKMAEWTRHKNNHSLGYFTEADIPFQFALAEAFTLCDAYHCSFQGGTNPNRLFLWSGSNDPLQRGHGPAINNDYDNLEHDPSGGYTWLTYCERLEAAGIRWQVYQNLADNFTDNPLAGFRKYRDAVAGLPGALAALQARGLSTRDLDLLKADVLNNRLPQVSWIVATAEGSEHPGPSSPAQGADYTARVLDALTSNPEVWSKSVLFVNFDENDGFFDHVPPPAVPSYELGAAGQLELAGDSTLSTRGEYHEYLTPSEDVSLAHKPYGLGPRVPMYVVSPWSKGGWVNSEVFDHTSVIRFIERRFGVREPNISEWRRAVCGDLVSAFNFADPDNSQFLPELPETLALAERARALPGTTTPTTPALALPIQDYGTRPSRALPYELQVHAQVKHLQSRIELEFLNSGRAGAVFHVYNRHALNATPRRYTVEAGRRLRASWHTASNAGAYDLWILGPNGFHRHFAGNTRLAAHSAEPEIQVLYDTLRGDIGVRLRNNGDRACSFVLNPNSYFFEGRLQIVLRKHSEKQHFWSLRRSARWYDFSATVVESPGYLRRFAGRVETGRDGYSDPALGGSARGEQT